MNVLSIETSTGKTSVAYIEDSFRFVERFLNHGKPSAGLMRVIDSTLKECGKTINDVDLFVVNTGPGSFTGIRIGLSTVYGLSYALSKPSVGVSSFEVIGCAVSSRLPIVVWIDTKQGDVYHAILMHKRDKIEYLSPPRTGEPKRLLDEIADSLEYPVGWRAGMEWTEETGFIFAGDGANKFRDLISKRLKGLYIFTECSLSTPSAVILGMLGMKKFRGKGINSPVPTPNYLKNFSVDKKCKS